MMNVALTNVKLLTGAPPGHFMALAHPSADEAHDEPATLEVIKAVHVRAETISAVLEDFLNLHPSTHWGINE